MARKSERASALSTAQLKRRLARWGADISGVADLEPFREYATIPAGLLEGYTRAVSIAVRVPAGVFETVGERPTPLYAAVYLTANRLLDDIAFRAAALFFERCRDRLTQENMKLPDVGVPICGVCIKVRPFGRQ